MYAHGTNILYSYITKFIPKFSSIHFPNSIGTWYIGTNNIMNSVVLSFLIYIEICI